MVTRPKPIGRGIDRPDGAPSSAPAFSPSPAYDCRMRAIGFRPWLLVSGLLFLAITLANPVRADRQVVRVEEGITVEEEMSPGRVLPILTGTTTMAATPERIAAWIGAIHTYVDWQHRCEEARVLPPTDGRRLAYNRIGSPWPVSDRDVVLESERTDFEDGRIHIEFRSTEAPDVPVPGGVVRMPRLVGSYDLTPTPEGTRVVYTVDSDPGGSLPGWLVRQASKDLPFHTLRNLRERVEAGPPPPAEAPSASGSVHSPGIGKGK